MAHPCEVHAVWLDEALLEAESDVVPELVRAAGELRGAVAGLDLQPVLEAAQELETALARLDFGLLLAAEGGWLARLRRGGPTAVREFGGRFDDVTQAQEELRRTLAAFGARLPLPGERAAVTARFELQRLQDLVEQGSGWARKMMRALVRRSEADPNVKLMAQFAALAPARLRRASDAAQAAARLVDAAQRLSGDAAALAGPQCEALERLGRAWRTRTDALLEEIEDPAVDLSARRSADCEQVHQELVRAAQAVVAACKRLHEDRQVLAQAQSLLAAPAG